MTRNTLPLAIILFIACLTSGCDTPIKNTSQQTKPHKFSKNYISILKKEKQRIDRLAQDTGALLVMVKVPHNDTLLKVQGDNYPDEIETTFNLLKGKNGGIIYAVEIPFSESGDWFIAYKSYFDGAGKILAFEREANFFNSACAGEEGSAAHEKIIKYYDESSGVIDSVYTLYNDKKKPLKKSDCNFNYDYPYTIPTTLACFLAINNNKI
jgi:hypothetical protein